jgi:hypothetical protein
MQTGKTKGPANRRGLRSSDYSVLAVLALTAALLTALTRAILLLLLAGLLPATLLSRLLAGLVALLLLARLLVGILVLILTHPVFLQRCGFCSSKTTFETFRPIK